jgi:hypothetical protein
MTAAEIRRDGINSPGNAFTGGGEAGTDRAVAENIGIVAGALIEIAAQLAELNEKLNPKSLVAAIVEIQGTLDAAELPL